MTDAEVDTEVVAHVARNRELVVRLAAKGVDLSAVRTVDLHFWSRSREDSEAMAVALRSQGLTDVRFNPTRGDSSLWNVEGRLLTTVERLIEKQSVEGYIRLARTHRCDFDGWGTEV